MTTKKEIELAGDMAAAIVETWKRTGFHGVDAGFAASRGSRVTILLEGVTYTLNVEAKEGK